jgi:tetratricopeptide (TPR) repeat protein
LVLVAFVALASCHPQAAVKTVPKNPANQTALEVTAVPDEAFGPSLHRLLRDGKASPERLSLLAGVVSRQLMHAGERFASRQQERGLASLSGAFLLVRAGEFRMEMVHGGDQALSSALALVAPRGDEGRTIAFLMMQNSLVPGGTPAKGDNEQHLVALKTWLRDTRGGTSLEALGNLQRVQTLRSLVEPTAESMSGAREATVQWIDHALRMNEDRKVGSSRPRREDAIEAFRAFRSGAETLAAIHLRNGDAAGALADIERSSARKITPPSLYDRLDHAGNGGDATAWRELLAWLWNPERKDSPGPTGADADPDLAVDPNLLKAALFGTATEAYRLDPTVPDVTIALATLLVQMGLPEAAPLVLADSTVSHPSPSTLSGALGLVLQTILREDEADDSATARRVYASAEPLLALASRPEWRGRVEPGAARLRLAMGTIETRAGNLAAAKPLLEGSAALDPTVEAHVALAAIERQAGKADAALSHLTRALASPDAKQNPIAAAETQLNIFEVQKDLGASDKANSALASALSSTLEARKRASNAVTKGHAERLLARVLFRFSDMAGAARATERAFVAAGQDKHELAATVLEAAQRAFLKKDVAGARAAVNRGLAGELSDDDVVYAALWLLFTEKDVKARSDGTASRALASIKDDGRWPSRLSLWGLGRMKDADLSTAARTAGQKTEASFYTALARKIAGDGAADKALAEVAKSPAIDLIEVQLARDLLAGPSRFSNGPTPAGLTIP